MLFTSYLLLALSLLVCGSLGQTFVPLQYVYGSNSTYQQGTFSPNATIYPGQYQTYYIDVQSIPKGYGISIYIESIDSTSYASIANMSLYLKKGQEAYDYVYDQQFATSCASTPCYNYFFAPSTGTCNPSDGYWYFSVKNTGSTVLTFQLEVDIDTFGGGFFDCSFGDDVSNAISTVFIVIFVLIGAVIIGVIACVVCCCVCAGAGAAAAAASYQPLPPSSCTTTTTHVQYAQAPAYPLSAYPPSTSYPPSAYPPPPSYPPPPPSAVPSAFPYNYSTPQTPFPPTYPPQQPKVVETKG